MALGYYFDVSNQVYKSAAVHPGHPGHPAADRRPGVLVWRVHPSLKKSSKFWRQNGQVSDGEGMWLTSVSGSARGRRRIAVS